MTLHGVEVPWAAVRPGHLYFWEACCRVERARPFIFNSFLFLGVLLGSGPFVGTTKWWFHFRVWRGSWGLWGGSRPAQNVPAKVVLGRGQVKFLPAVTPGLWLKNWGTQAGAAQPRGLCKHGRCSQESLLPRLNMETQSIQAQLLSTQSVWQPPEGMSCPSPEI